jgi:thiol-disulfide isomerase/thioredoxin
MKRLCYLVALVGFCLSSFAAEESPPTLALGSPAPDFNLPGVDGKSYSLKDFASAKVLAVLFTCNHCPTAQYYEERIKQLVSDYKDQGVALVAISPNDPKSVRLDELGYTDLSDSFEEMKIRATHRQFNFPYLYDGDKEEVSRAYGPLVTPHVFLFDAERKLRYVGRIDDDERGKNIKTHDTRNAIEALLAGREVEVKQTRVIGCSVKWKGKEESVKQFMAKLAAEPVNVDLVDPDGLRALRKNDSGKLRLINCWATWCGPCVTEFPELVSINRMYRQRDFELVTVAANYPDEQKDVLNFLKKQQASNKNLLFGTPEKYKLIEAFDADWSGALPFTLLLDADGKVLYRREGPIDALELKRLIVKTLNARKPW